MFRIGFGFDVHGFEKNSLLVIGGVKIPYSKGLQGHSDADVLLHAIIDSFLGALCQKDIGTHFPDNDENYANISSMVLLEKVWSLVLQKGYNLVNLDTTIIAQEPKISPYIDSMVCNIAKCLNVALNKINIKATTTEYLGFVGRKEGIAACAITLISKGVAGG